MCILLCFNDLSPCSVNDACSTLTQTTPGMMELSPDGRMLSVPNHHGPGKDLVQFGEYTAVARGRVPSLHIRSKLAHDYAVETHMPKLHSKSTDRCDGHWLRNVQDKASLRKSEPHKRRFTIVIDSELVKQDWRNSTNKEEGMHASVAFESKFDSSSDGTLSPSLSESKTVVQCKWRAMYRLHHIAYIMYLPSATQKGELRGYIVVRRYRPLLYSLVPLRPPQPFHPKVTLHATASQPHGAPYSKPSCAK